MAAPIAHIFLAMQMLAGPFDGLFNEIEFIVGTSFPDIRYLKVISRDETHFCNVTLDDIVQEKDSFKAGMLFHSFVDEQREAYILAHKFYSKIPSFRFVTQSLKFAEDEILRTLFDSSEYSSYFDEILEQEKAYPINIKHIQTWHRFLGEYCSGAYSCRELIMKYFDIMEPHAWLIKKYLFMWLYVSKMEQVVSYITKNKWAKKAILDFYLHFVDRHASSLKK